MGNVFTDIFTGAPAKEAAQKTQDYLSGVQATGNANINTGLLNARGAVGGGLDASRAALGQGYTTATGDVNAGGADALGYLGAGAAAGRGQYDAARGAFAPLSDLAGKYGGGTDLYLNSLGVNGAEGNAAARSAFDAGPGYNFARDQGLEAINRRRNMGGMLASGNADRDATDYATGLAQQAYGGWQDRLAGLVNPELQATSGAASGIAGVDVNQAGAENTLGQNQAGVATGRAGMLADLASRYGLNSANTETGAANTLAGLEQGAAGQKVGLGTSIAQPYANTYGQVAAAEQGGSGNMWKLGIEAAKAAATGGASLAMPSGSGTGMFGGTSGNFAAPYYSNKYASADQLFPGFGTG